MAAVLQLSSAAVEHLAGRRRGLEGVVRQTTASRNFNRPCAAIKRELGSRAVALDGDLGTVLRAEREQRGALVLDPSSDAKAGVDGRARSCSA
jgi:hypothetical protein